MKEIQFKRYNDMLIKEKKMKNTLHDRFVPLFRMCRMCRAKMCRALAGQNVSQRATRVVECVVNHDTYDTFLFSVHTGRS